jgi:hypothetical protein
MTTVSPSPRDLFARLSDEEKVAVDFLLQEDGDEVILTMLVADSRRRGHVRGLAMQSLTSETRRAVERQRRRRARRRGRLP